MTVKGDPVLNEGEKLEGILRGKFKIIQKEKGYRFSVDPLLLSDFVEIAEGETVIDLGTGCGVMPIILAEKTKAEKLVGVDIQKEMVSMAERSVDYNEVQDVVDIVECDLKSLDAKFDAESFDVVLSNPPYIPVKAGRINPLEEKAIARHEILADLSDVISGAKYLLKPKGRLFLIYTTNRLVELLSSLHDSGLEPKFVKFVYSNENSAAKLVLVKAVKGGKGELTVQKPLYIYNLEGDYTDEASSILENGNGTV